MTMKKEDLLNIVRVLIDTQFKKELSREDTDFLFKEVFSYYPGLKETRADIVSIVPDNISRQNKGRWATTRGFKVFLKDGRKEEWSYIKPINNRFKKHNTNS